MGSLFSICRNVRTINPPYEDQKPRDDKLSNVITTVASSERI